MPTAPTSPKRLWFKHSYLHPHVAPPPGESTQAAKWQEFTDSSFAQEAIKAAYGEYVSSLVAEPAMPGVAAFKAQGAKEFAHVLLNLGEPDRPVGVPDRAAQLTPV